jgi:signal transduction histidine kinase
VRVAIRDCGPGIAPSDAALLFRRFGRSSSEHAGFGLGLALCREIARRHDGRIDLSSAPGAGTEVVVELPARAEPPDGAPDATPGAR